MKPRVLQHRPRLRSEAAAGLASADLALATPGRLPLGVLVSGLLLLGGLVASRATLPTYAVTALPEPGLRCGGAGGEVRQLLLRPATRVTGPLAVHARLVPTDQPLQTAFSFSTSGVLRVQVALPPGARGTLVLHVRRAWADALPGALAALWDRDPLKLRLPRAPRAADCTFAPTQEASQWDLRTPL